MGEPMRIRTLCVPLAVVAAFVATGCHGPRFSRLSDLRHGQPVEGLPADARAAYGPGGAGAPVGPGQPGYPPTGYPGGPACGPNGQPWGPGMGPGGMAPWNNQPCPPPGQHGPPGQPCPPPGQPCPPQPREAPRQAPVAEREQVTETRSASAAVTQDILLIPRTVYVPYAPHVPVAPARLAMTSPAARVIETEERVREISRVPEPAPREAAPRDTRVSDALDKCLDEMRKLNQRIGELESRAQQQMCMPPAAPCPPPGPSPFYYPGRDFSYPQMVPAGPVPQGDAPPMLPPTP